MGFEWIKIYEDAVTEKFEHPDREVLCPRCGKHLNYRRIGNSVEVKCETENCLVDTIRGL